MGKGFRYAKHRKVYAREHLAAAGKKQADVVRASNIDKGSVSEWFKHPERQGSHVLSVIADVCGVDVTDLFHPPGTRPTVAQIRAARETIDKLAD